MGPLEFVKAMGVRARKEAKRGNEWPVGRTGHVEVEEKGPEPRDSEPQLPDLAQAFWTNKWGWVF